MGSMEGRRELEVRGGEEARAKGLEAGGDTWKGAAIKDRWGGGVLR